ncbi:MAG: hypothetical protein N2312_04350 [Dictyoglomaceae bacterium]|nr:hypothetical protein [Dictyoglomaceae bacterium]
MNNPVPCRKIFSDTLLEYAKKDKDIIVLTTDARFSASVDNFADNLPDQFIEIGIAEQNAIGISAGLSKIGKKPFVFIPACFLSSRCVDQIKVDIVYSHSNVKLIGVSGGVSYGPLGYTHHAINDIAIMRTFPKMLVILPTDIYITRLIVKELVNYKGPVYVRMGRNPVPRVYDESNVRFEIGKGNLLLEGKDVAIIGTGETTYYCIETAKLLKENNISATVIDMPTVKPLDKEIIMRMAKEIGKIVVVEEHSIYGGLGSSIAEFLSHHYPIPIKIIGIPDEFPISGNSNQIFDYYGMTPNKLAQTVINFLKEFK